MVLSQMQFGQYLHMPCYAAAAALSPTPVILSQQYRSGDNGVLIIHSKYGLISGEIKRVGFDYLNSKMTEEEKDKDLEKNLKEAVMQLRKTDLEGLVPDLKWVRRSRILILPNIDSNRLSRVIKSIKDTEQVRHFFFIE